MGDVDVRVADVESLAAALVRFRAASQDQIAVGVRALQQARDRVRDRRTERERDLRRATESLEAAEAALRACEENCTGLERAVTRAMQDRRDAEDRLNRVMEAQRLLEQQGTDFVERVRSIRDTVDVQVPAGVEALRRFSEQIGHYLSVQIAGRGTVPSLRPVGGGAVNSGRGPSNGLATGPAGGTAAVSGAAGTLPGGTVLMALDQIDASDSTVRGPGDFGKVSQADMAWGVDRLDRTVLPEVQAGKDLSHFQARDAAEGLDGDRSYASVYQAFFGSSSPMKVSRRADGRYGLVNGYHRFHVAQQLGVTVLPVRVIR